MGLRQGRCEPCQRVNAEPLTITGNPRDPHWTDSAKNLIRGIALHLLATNPKQATMRELRRLLNATPAELERLFEAMVESSAFDGIVANIGASFLGKKESGGRELQGILSTAQEQTSPLDDIIAITERSDFALGELQGGKLSLYLRTALASAFPSGHQSRSASALGVPRGGASAPGSWSKGRC